MGPEWGVKRGFRGFCRGFRRDSDAGPDTPGEYRGLALRVSAGGAMFRHLPALRPEPLDTVASLDDPRASPSRARRKPPRPPETEPVAEPEPVVETRKPKTKAKAKATTRKK